VTPVLAFDEAIRDPQFAARGMIVRRPDGSRQYAPPFSMTPSAFAIARDAPRQGEHSREVLREAGYGNDAIDALIAAGTLREG
jgi:crotonobetainyl-CoA:carnitine CoA-transferase CaiB-like acyl-CoA transferase